MATRFRSHLKLAFNHKSKSDGLRLGKNRSALVGDAQLEKAGRIFTVTVCPYFLDSETCLILDQIGC